MEVKLEDIDTPFLWVDLDIMEDNISSLSSFFKSKNLNWRPHVKGIKTPEIAKKIINSGAIGVTCAKLSEAEVMVSGGVESILIANQIVGSKKIERLCALSNDAEIITAVDDAGVVQMMNQIAQQKSVNLNVLIEINIGMNRAGITQIKDLLNLCQLIDELDHINFLGFMGWEGHAAGMEDSPYKREAIDASMKLLKVALSECKQKGFHPKIISGGGSGTYLICADYGLHTEIQAGGAVFTDSAYHLWGTLTTPSIFVRSVVTSRPDPSRIITDSGWKSLPCWVVDPIPKNVDGCNSVRMSSEHGILNLDQENTDIRPGDFIDFQVGYGDSTVFLHQKLHGVRNGELESTWDIAGRGKVF